MIRSALNAVARKLGYVRRPCATVVTDEGPEDPFTRADIDAALNMAFVQGLPVGMRMTILGANNRDLKITLSFRHRTAA